MYRYFIITLAAFAVGGCAVSNFTPSSGTVQQKPVQKIQISPKPEPKPSATTTALIEDQGATSPWDYIELSRRSFGEQKNTYLLEAIEGFLDLSQDATARTLLEGLETEQLTDSQGQRRLMLLARSHYLAGNFRRTERILKNLAEQNGLDREMVSSILLLRAKTQSALSNPEGALRLLVAREPFLQEPQAVLENQSTIWRVLGLISVETLEQIRITSPIPTLSKWADLALLSQRIGWNTHQLQQQLDSWGQLNPTHPATNALIPDLLNNLGGVLTQYQTIAMLLPLTSGYGTAAKAFFDGFSLMQNVDTNPRKPRVLVYDIGEKPELISFYYEAAIREGAQFVIGPLGKQAVDGLVAEQELHVPTLLLGNTGNITAGKKNALQFGLSPEAEAREVARKAWQDGHRIAAILYPEVDWGVRQVEAFTKQWISLGGQIAETGQYATQRPDHTQTIKLLLNIDESENRRRNLRRYLDMPLEFLARKRQDLDFIFLVSRSESGRLLKPQLNFHNASAIPVYSISQIFSGGKDKVKDLDLDGIIFGDMPWLVLNTGSSKYMRENLAEANQYAGQPLDRLFALGLDTYQLLFRLEQMKQSQNLTFKGTTGTLRLNPDGVIGRELEWSQFVEGEPASLSWESALAD